MLVTLAIVGVLASMTIPTMLQNINNAQNKAAWKKTFADFNQAFMSIIFDSGGSFKGAVSSEAALRNIFANKFNVIKYCGGGYTWDSNCWYGGVNPKYSDGTSFTDFDSAGQDAMFLNNGNYLRFISTDLTNCNNRNFYFNDSQGGGLCGYIYADVNGSKSPNVVGKDIYLFYIAQDRLYPGGSGDDRAATCSTTGWGCAAQYLYN